MKTAIGCWLMALSYGLSAQAFKKGNFAIGGMYQTHLLGKSTTFEKMYGIQASYFVTDRWAIDYSLSYVYVPFGTSYFKVYGGAAVAGYGTVLASNSINNDGYWALVVLALLIPEGVSCHFPVNNQITVSPYVSALTVDISNQYWRFSNTAGMRLNMVLNETFNVSPYVCSLVQYRGNSVGGSVGGLGAGVLGRWVF